MTTDRKKFQQLLEELFQFDSADLDFGIYRIMNYKRAKINTLVREELQQKVDAALEERADKNLQDQLKQLAKCEANIKKFISRDAFDERGKLKQEHHSSNLGQDWLELARLTAHALDVEALIKEAYIHLYTFFARYYEDGDFIAKHRYAHAARYAVPYSGEEVLLHWANKDQYYIKTSQHFVKYEFVVGKTRRMKVKFEVQGAQVAQDNKQEGKNKYFIPQPQDLICTKEELILPFHHRQLGQAELEELGNQHEQLEKTEQGKYNNAIDGVQSKMLELKVKELGQKEFPIEFKKALFAKTDIKDKQGNLMSLLEKHLLRYVRRNTSDYFIHKNLHHFLRQELNHYLRSEFLDADELAAHGVRLGAQTFILFGVIQEVGYYIIDFLAQIENFQKMLWEKRKFILDTHYCIAMHAIKDQELRQQVAANNKQWQEWRQLGMLAAKDENKLSRQERLEYLNEHEALMIDTRYFDEDFKDRLLACFTDIDALCGGVLIHGENFQGLNTLMEKYRKQVKCVYIDPPYNTQANEIIYKNTYKHSSWASLIKDRVALSKCFLRSDAVFACSIDENEQKLLGYVLDDSFFGEEYRKDCVTVVQNPRGIRGMGFSYTHDYIYFVSHAALNLGLRKLVEDKPKSFMKTGLESGRHTAKNCFYPILVKKDKVIGFGDVPEDDYHPDAACIKKGDDEWEIWPISTDKTERKWRYARQTIEDHIESLYVTGSKVNGMAVYMSKQEESYRTVWYGGDYNAAEYGSNLLKNIFGTRSDFSFPKSIRTIYDILHVADVNAENLVLDYFAGSGTTGHAVIDLNRADGGSRKFILMEVNDYFDTVLLPRLKKIVYAPEWKEGQPKQMAMGDQMKNAPHLIKYHRLESYEDSLDNIKFDEDDVQFEYDDYVPKYILEWETRACATLANTKVFNRPFDYTLRLASNGIDHAKQQRVDLAETFNYLLGLHVCTRRVLQDGERRYLVYCGKASDKDTLIIWRDTAGWKTADFNRDRDFINKEILPDDPAKRPYAIYVNDNSIVKGARSLNSLFKKRMFASVRPF